MKKKPQQGKSRITTVISFRASNEIHKKAAKKVGKKNINKHCLALLIKDVES